MTWAIASDSFEASTVGCAPSKSSVMPLKSRFKLDMSSAEGSMLIDEASKAGRLDRSMPAPERFRLLDRSAEDSPAVSLD